jgi:hypothetical protein
MLFGTSPGQPIGWPGCGRMVNISKLRQTQPQFELVLGLSLAIKMDVINKNERSKEEL